MSREWSETQVRILRATHELFEARGPDAVRLEDVAAKAGVSRQAVYLNFGSRAGLLVALIRFIDQLGRVPEHARRFQDPERSACERLDEFLTWWMRYSSKIRGVARALLASRSHDEAAAAAWQDRMNALHATACQIVDDLAKEGRLAEHWKAAEAADWLWALISVQLRETLLERGWSQRRYADRLVRVVHAALLTPESD